MIDHEQLIRGWQDGELTESERAALSKWLMSDVANLRHFVDSVLFDEEIRSIVVAREQQSAFSPTMRSQVPSRLDVQPRANSRFFIRGWLWTLAVLGATAVAALLYRAVRNHAQEKQGRSSLANASPATPAPLDVDTKSAKPSVQAQAPVVGVHKNQDFCRLVRVAGVEWSDGRTLQQGSRIGKGRIKLVAGTAEFRFDNGVHAICTGPAELEIRDPMHAWLHYGQVVFRVPRTGIGFELETNDAVIVDLGTEFGVRVDEPIANLPSHAAALERTERNGLGTELQVFEGEVIANVKSDPMNSGRLQHRVQSGQAMRIGSNVDGAVQELPFHPERFVYEMPDPKDHPEAVGKPFPKKSPYNKAQHESIRIFPAPLNIAVDGSLDDWDLRGQFYSECPPPWRDFYNVRGALMYDERFLYIGAVVADPFPLRSTVSPTPGRELYGGGGSVVLKISTDRKMGWPAVAKRRAHPPNQPEFLPEDCNERLTTLVMWHYAAESQACLDVRYGIDHHGRRLNPPGYRGAWKLNADGMGYTMEYAIPWSLLNAAEDPPRAGDTLACTWLTHWSDSAGQNWRGQLIEIVNPQETGWNFQNAGTWGRALYMGKDAIE